MTLKRISILLLIMSLTACATTPPAPRTAVPVQTDIAADSPPAWRTCYFKIAWTEDSTPRWEVDLLLAHQLIGPVLSEHGDQLQSWRFHRRAARDHAGHLFRFHYYTDPARAAVIIDRIHQNPLLSSLLAAHILESANCDSPADMTRPHIGDTSDPAWPETVRKHWPAYIMGISRFWLGLIDDAIGETGNSGTDIDTLLQRYSEANETLTATWQAEGEHALLHHLSGIFGYQALPIRF